jgi:hypothetical protein
MALYDIATEAICFLCVWNGLTHVTKHEFALFITPSHCFRSLHKLKVAYRWRKHTVRCGYEAKRKFVDRIIALNSLLLNERTISSFSVVLFSHLLPSLVTSSTFQHPSSVCGIPVGGGQVTEEGR